MKRRFSKYRLDYKTAKNGRHLYPWAQMTYGDYVIVPKKLSKKASAAAYMYGSRKGRYFRCSAFGTKGRVKITHLPSGDY
jgi:hypothetical protein